MQNDIINTTKPKTITEVYESLKNQIDYILYSTINEFCFKDKNCIIKYVRLCPSKKIWYYFKQDVQFNETFIKYL